MKNNKLTLKALHKELENLKTSTSSKASKTQQGSALPLSDNHHHSTLGREIKNSYINNLHMKSSFVFWWIMSWFIFFAKDFPIINKISGLVTLWYGRTTAYKILVKCRKVFVVFNAIIGMYFMYKTTGFSFNNILAGFSGLGHTYLEIFVNFNKRLFHWLVELFDHKVVPNVPNNPSGGTPKPSESLTGQFWKARSSISDSIESKFSLRELYKNPFNINIEVTPWYKDTTILWWVGGLAVTAGVSFLGYKLIFDPSFFGDWFNFKSPTIKTTPPTPDSSSSVLTSAAASAGIPNPTDVGNTVGLINNNKSNPLISGAEAIVNGTKSILTGIKKLNPTYWFLSSDNSAEQVFMAEQTVDASHNPQLYPFTQYNPYDSWIKRMRIHYLGETHYECVGRLRFRQSLIDKFTYVLNKGKDVDTTGSGLASAASSMPSSPRIGSLGLQTAMNFTSENFTELVPGSSGSVARRFSSLPATPINNPVGLPEGIEGTNAEWNATISTPYDGEWTDPKPYNFFSSSSSNCESSTSSYCSSSSTNGSNINSPNNSITDLADENPYNILGLVNI